MSDRAGVLVGVVVFIVIGALCYFRSMNNGAGKGNPDGSKEVVNWNAPAKKDLVQRALSDGMTDPAKIVAWAANYKVTLTVEEVLRLEAQLKK
jgi:hypothetical protein